MAEIRVGGHSPMFSEMLNVQPGPIDGTTVSKQTFYLYGLDADGLVLVNSPQLEDGLIVIQALVPAKDTITLWIWNTTGDIITPAAQNFYVYQP